ncbi:MAG: peptide-methionine (R)-S-oxide reductase MsrB [Flavobacteriaceae bacterium]|jgi:peptide-methionine (R)-S-oxide reductase|nr:peptide-methionine (R)-S-oxide reductase MsrB [Flavobacteriaceae bacterium]MDG1961993.1 peptide-methionine (R)-S-oxide reductase MsrB [Flavobacteriaceae bacterium]
MKTRYLLILSTILVFTACQSRAQEQKPEHFEIEKTTDQWRSELTPSEFAVLREAATEPPFSSIFNTKSGSGTYHCAGCGAPLFKSNAKFDSGSGWPSFDRCIEGQVRFSTDYDLGYARTEEHCAKCGGHLGHVFPDGPRNTTGMRHCINGVALDFIPEQ